MAGVRRRGLIRASRAGSAPCAAIASTARAVGMIVVCVEAAVEVSTHRISSLPAVLPRTALAIALSTSELFADRNAGPAKASAAVLTTAKTATRMSVDMTPALPGVRLESFVSSLTDSAQSQPQYTNTASRNESDSVLNDPVHGFSQCRAGACAPGSACPEPTRTKATIAK